jgi:sugar phosphate isomerase/epimerase
MRIDGRERAHSAVVPLRQKREGIMAIELVTSSCCLPNLTRAEFFAAAKSCGYSKVELFATWTQSKFSDSDGGASVNQDGVGVSAVHLPGDVKTAQKIISTAAACGIPQVVVHGAGKPADAGTWLKPLVVHARPLGVEVVLTNHKGQSIESPEDVQTALDACGGDRPAVLLEAGQFWAAGDDALAAFKRFEPAVRLIHIKDLDAAGKSVPFGHGCSPLPEFLQYVAGSSYSGRIVIEVEMKTAPAEQLIEILRDARVKCAEWLGVAAASRW